MLNGGRYAASNYGNVAASGRSPMGAQNSRYGVNSSEQDEDDDDDEEFEEDDDDDDY